MPGADEDGAGDLVLAIELPDRGSTSDRCRAEPERIDRPESGAPGIDGSPASTFASCGLSPARALVGPGGEIHVREEEEKEEAPR